MEATKTVECQTSDDTDTDTDTEGTSRPGRISEVTLPSVPALSRAEGARVHARAVA